MNHQRLILSLTELRALLKKLEADEDLESQVKQSGAENTVITVIRGPISNELIYKVIT